jgi:segregation and condensation protein B
MSNPEAEHSEVPAEAVEPSAEAAFVENLEAVAEDASELAPTEGDVVAPEPVAPAIPSPANDDVLLRRALEGLLFITDRPLSAAELGKLVGIRDQDKIIGTVEELRRDLEAKNAGYRLIAVAEGWQMATRPELAPYMRKLFADRATMRLSTAAQETLSIISYKQPLTRAEIEEIRGVEVIAALETLLEKGLTKVVGRKETVGRPLMYGTTSEFLRHFGLRSLEDLPPIDSFTPAEDVPPSAAPADAAAAPAPEVPAAEFAPEIAAQTEEAVIAETLSEHPAESRAEEPVEPATDAAPESAEDPLWPK